MERTNLGDQNVKFEHSNVTSEILPKTPSEDVQQAVGYEHRFQGRVYISLREILKVKLQQPDT